MATLRALLGPGTRRAEILLWVLALGVGAVLRLAFLLDETPHFDEWHPLLAVKRQGVEKLATTFGVADRSIPVALYLELLSRTSGLTDFAARAPFVAIGLASLVLLPWALVRRGRHASLLRPVFALLLALSPLLVYYSRTIRPYGATTLLAVLAIAALERHRRSGGRRLWLALAVAASAATAWLLPVHFPFCFAALSAAWLQTRWRRGGREARPYLVAAAVALALALLPLVPALARDAAALVDKAGTASWRPFALSRAPALLCGTRSVALGWIWLAAAALFCARAAKRGDATRQLLAAGALGQVVALALIRPFGLHDPIILGRYLLPLAPVGWVCVLDGARTLGGRRRAARGAPWQPMLLLALAALLFWTGPLRGWLGPGPDNFASMRLHLRFVAGDEAAAVERPTPAVYELLRNEPPGSSAVLEVPYTGYVAEPYAFYQRDHRQVVFVGVTTGFCSPPRTIELPPDGERGFLLRRILALGDLDRLRRAGVRHVFLHRDSRQVAGGVELTNAFWDYRRCVDAFSALLGAAPVEDERTARFDLDPPVRTP